MRVRIKSLFFCKHRIKNSNKLLGENAEFFTPGGTLRFKHLHHKYENCINIDLTKAYTEDKSVLTETEWGRS
jgi:hypothetical protein